MGELADRLDKMVVRVAAPSGNVAAELRGRTEVRVRFAPGYYDQATERDLEAQLASVGKLLWAARMKAYDAILTEICQRPMSGEAPANGARDVEYRKGRDQLVAVGHSSDRRVLLAVRGMREWRVKVEAGTVAALREYEFAARVGEAAAGLIRDQLQRIRLLKHETFH